MRYDDRPLTPLRQESQLCQEKPYSLLPGRRPMRAGGSNPKNLKKFCQGSLPLPLKHAKRFVFLVLVSLLLLGGCSRFHNWTQQPVSIPIKTNLYAEFDGWQSASFSAKPFSSLLQHSFCEEGGDYDPDLSSDGRWIVFSSLRHAPNPDIYVKQVSGSTSTRLTSDPGSEIQPSFSPLGDKVAYASNRSGHWDIWVIGIDGTNPTRLTSSAGNDIHPSWSPDGKHIVYCSYGARSNQWELWVVDVQSPSTKRWIGYGLFPAWGPDQKTSKIAFQLARYRGSQWFSIWTVEMIDGEAKYPTEIVTSADHACICPTWSSDGAQLAYSTVGRSVYEKVDAALPNSTGEDVWIVDLDGRNNLRLTNGDASNFSPTWAPDSRVFFCSDRNEVDNIWSVKPYRLNLAADKAVDLSRHPQSSFQAN